MALTVNVKIFHGIPLSTIEAKAQAFINTLTVTAFTNVVVIPQTFGEVKYASDGSGQLVDCMVIWA